MAIGFITLTQPDSPDGYGKTIPGDQIEVNLDYVVMVAPTKIAAPGDWVRANKLASQLTLSTGKQVVVVEEPWTIRNAIQARQAQ